MDYYTIGLAITTGIFILAFLITGYRLLVGPNSIDRLVALDGIAAMIQCAMAVYICWTFDTTVSNTMMVVALLGFIGTIALIRFRKRDDAS